MVSDNVLCLSTSSQSIAAELAKDPTQEVDKVVKSLRKEWKSKTSKQSKQDGGKSRLDRAASCGRFPERPSDLFLKIYSDVVETLNDDPFANLVSPSLVGSSGVIPLSIVSVIPDIMRHYADLIVRAQREVFIATNYWEDSHSAALVADALRTLSRRDANCTPEARVAVKLIYDRGTPAQLVNNHAPVPPEKWTDVGLPRPEELTGIHFEVVNYHRPPLGTFHAKYLVVDRQVACLNSNNIQDRPNVEMMVHFEGPVVESFYDVALFSWANAFDPPLPLLREPPVHRGEYKFGWDNEHLKYIDTEFTSKASCDLLGKQQDRDAQPSGAGDRRAAQSADGSIIGHAVRAAVGIYSGDGGVLGKDDLVGGGHPAPDVQSSTRSSEKQDGEAEGGNVLETSPDDAELQVGARQNRARQPAQPNAGPDPSVQNKNESHTDSVSSSSNIDRHSGPEVLKSDLGDADSEHRSRLSAITAHLNAQKFDGQGTAADDASLDDFRPHIMHAPHAPVPIAMVNRAPRGTPGHEGENDVPQNVAWLSALKYAEKSVFIQTPTFNASPVIPATIDACRRGVEVTLYLNLGFNDLGEMIPFQGGTNEQVVHNMYKILNAEGKQDNLRVFWYTAKDQDEPMSATKKARNCHVKFMSVDDRIAILGNGNQDTQSWFHSQEVNVLVDSAHLVAEWRAGIDANQNTRGRGRVDAADGVWRARDGSGRVVQSSGTQTAGLLGGLKGISGAIRRLRGTGGF